MGTTFRKFRHTGHLMVPLGSLGHFNMFGAILALVDQHWSMRSTYGDVLCMVVEVHVLVQCLVGHV